MTVQPTDEQINERFWNFVGIELRVYEMRFGGPPQPRTGWYLNGEYKFGKFNRPNFLDPEKGMGLMFKYVVPKIIGDEKYSLYLVTDVDYYTRDNMYIFRFSNDPLYVGFEISDKDPTRSLAMAIYKAIGGDDEDTATQSTGV